MPIDRLARLRTLALPATVLLACAMLAGAAIPQATAAPGRPNIVFLLTDDLDQASARTMPELQALARQGASFEAAYAITPMCVPSRATILTGKYPQNSGVRSNRLPAGGYQAFHQGGQEDATFAVWLQSVGYRTAMIGKYLNWYPITAGALHVPRGWTRWVTPSTELEIHAKYNYHLNEDGVEVAYGNAPADYATDVYARKALEFIDESAAAGKPFALFLSVTSPHLPETPAPRHTSLFADATAPRLPSFPEPDTSDKPSFLRFPLLPQDKLDEIDHRYRLRLRMLRSVDEALGDIRRLLAARGLLDETFIVFTSDHGWHQGQHNQMPMKGRAYEEDVRVPLVVSGPGVPRGRKIRRLVGLGDLAPTFADWAGTAPSAPVDGRSFAPLLTAADPAALPWRRNLPLMRSIEGRKPTVRWPAYRPVAGLLGAYACLDGLVPATSAPWPEWRGVRTERVTYVEHATGDRELYQTSGSDPFQLRNAICRTPPTERERLANLTAALASCRGATCRELEDR